MKNLLARVPAFLKRKKFLYTVGGLIALFILMNYVLLPLYVSHGGTLAVPSVVGMPLEDARSLLDSYKLEGVTADTLPDPKLARGTVIRQNPEASAIVKYGRRVYLTVSGGEITVSVPALRGRSLRDAKFALERFGLRLGSVDYDISETFPRNTIMDQTLAPNTRVKRGTPIGVRVSAGKDTAQVAVPSLAGKSTTEAERLLTDAGLKVGNITLQSSFDLLPNTVVDQFPRAGEHVQPGQAVDLFVVRAGRPSEEIKPPGR